MSRVPRREHAGHPAKQRVEADAQRGDHDEPSVEVLGAQGFPGQPHHGAQSSFRRDELDRDRHDQRRVERDPHAREDRRQARRHDDLQDDVKRAGSVVGGDLQIDGVDLPYAGHGVDEEREAGSDGRRGHDRGLSDAEHHEDQGQDCGLGDWVHGCDDGIPDPAQSCRPAHRQAEPQADRAADDEAEREPQQRRGGVRQEDPARRESQERDGNGRRSRAVQR